MLYLHRRVGGGGDDAGKLCVVDLAGSERLKKSGSVGLAQKEAVCINRSLHALSQVVQALATKAAHVPTRACGGMVDDALGKRGPWYQPR